MSTVSAPPVAGHKVLETVHITHTTTSISNPVFVHEVRLDTKQGQHIMKRAFRRASFSLFSIDVILRIIGEDNEVDSIDEIITEYLNEQTEDLQSLENMLTTLVKQANIQQNPSYTLPQTYIIEVSSPQVLKLSNIINKFDDLMKIVDSLWINGHMDNKQRTVMSHEWKARVFKLTTKIIQLEKRARNAAGKRGHHEKVTEALGPDQTEQSADLEKEDEQTEAA